jgi:PKD repeat protein
MPVDRRWSEPVAEGDFERFRLWTERYRAASTENKPALEAEGVQLATARREELGVLIRTRPERALDLGVPVGVRRELPDSVTALLEERIDGRGDLAVLATTPLPGQEGTAEPLWRTAILGERTFRAHVYGRRLDEPARFNVALHGVALDGQMAVDENPARVLEAEEVEQYPPVIHLCALPRIIAHDAVDGVLLDVGDTLPRPVCGAAHAEALNLQQILEESDADSTEVTASGRIRRASAYTEGNKRAIFIRVDFSDRAGSPFTDSAGTNLLNALHTYFQENSFGRTRWLPFGTNGAALTPTLRMPKTSAAYGALDPSVLRTDARNAATAAGFKLGSYQFDLTCFTSVPNYGWAGLGYVGAPGSWIQGSFDSSGGVSAHELGHNLGLNHANFWDTAGANAIGNTGTDVEYGDTFDTMGNASAGRRHFNTRNKVALDWIRSTQVTTFSTNGVYRLFAHDVTNAVTGARALKVARNSRTNYWFEFRQKFTDNRWLMNGLGVRWARSDNNRQSLLLDTTPGSTDGKNDSAIVIGRTFSDPDVGLHITPLRKNGTVPESLDVQFYRGKFTNDIAPVVALSASSDAVAANALVRFTATASDADGDALAYFWDFGDGSFGTNGATASKAWSTTGDYLVRCTVTDMKGGTATDSVAVKVGSVTSYRLTGAVTRDGRPLGGVRVFTSNTKLTYTDSDGSYILPGVTAGSYTLRAQTDGLLFTRAFTNPVVVNRNLTNLNFTGSLPGDLETAILVPAGAEWRYDDTGVNRGTTWRASAFNDSTWKKGPAQLGYGDPEVVTTIGFGPDANAKYPTAYFRHEFFVDDPARFVGATLGLIRDDGAIVYLNGREVFRSNLPTGTVNHNTLASTTVGGADEITYFETELTPTDFAKGRNVLAVAVHQAALNSSDLRFNLRIDALLKPSSSAGGEPAITLERNEDSVRILWPAAFTGFGVQQRRSFDATTDWEPSPYPLTSVGETNAVTVPLTEEALLLRLSR